MGESAKIVGVYAVEGIESVYLIEMLIDGDQNLFDISRVTQRIDGVDELDWQVPWDEQTIEEGGDGVRIAFFFHHLDLYKPMITPFGEVALPAVTEAPAHLSSLTYEPPC